MAWTGAGFIVGWLTQILAEFYPHLPLHRQMLQITASRLLAGTAGALVYALINLLPPYFLQLRILLPVFWLASAVDQRTGEIPDLCWLILLANALMQPLHLTAMLISLLLSLLFCCLGWLGGGDVKLLSALALQTGPAAATAVLCAALLCLPCFLLTPTQEKKPFAPFLCSGFLFTFLLGSLHLP